MSKKRKLYEKVLAGSNNIRFDDLVTLLIAFGFQLDRTAGSHYIFKHPKVAVLLSLQTTSNGQAKPYQIRQFLGLVEQYALTIDAKADEQD